MNIPVREWIYITEANEGSKIKPYYAHIDYDNKKGPAKMFPHWN